MLDSILSGKSSLTTEKIQLWLHKMDNQYGLELVVFYDLQSPW
jgi:hypothetical protein